MLTLDNQSSARRQDNSVLTVSTQSRNNVPRYLHIINGDSSEISLIPNNQNAHSSTTNIPYRFHSLENEACDENTHDPLQLPGYSEATNDLLIRIPKYNPCKYREAELPNYSEAVIDNYISIFEDLFRPTV